LQLQVCKIQLLASEGLQQLRANLSRSNLAQNVTQENNVRVPTHCIFPTVSYIIYQLQIEQTCQELERVIALNKRLQGENDQLNKQVSHPEINEQDILYSSATVVDSAAERPCEGFGI
jgi:hypothetical protein